VFHRHTPDTGNLSPANAAKIRSSTPFSAQRLKQTEIICQFPKVSDKFRPLPPFSDQ
jgi:hypothetical protein